MHHAPGEGAPAPHTVPQIGEGAGLLGSPDLLADAYHRAADAHAAALRAGSPAEVCAAYRAVLVAEIALLRDCPGRFDRAAADELAFALEDRDRELAADPSLARA